METYPLQRCIDRPLQETPDKVAVTDGQASITYRELSESSNRLAHCLISHGVGYQDRVVFCMKRSVNCLTAILAILKAGATYVPVDLKAPGARLKKIVQDCAPAAIICDDETLKLVSDLELPAGQRHNIISLGTKGQVTDSPVCYFWRDVHGYGAGSPGRDCADSDIAYILYTSGSTGDPKGVLISHLNVRSYIDWAVECFSLTPEDKILSTAPFHFDMSTFDIYCALKAGGTLCIATEDMLLFPSRLTDFMDRQRVTVWKGISSLLMYLAVTGSLKADRLTDLKKVMFGGETLPSKYLIQWMKTYPEKMFYNVYGPTEATGVSMYYHIEEIPSGPHEIIPIGRPRKDTDIVIIGDDNGPVKDGEIGELCIGGPGLCKGYLNDPEKTERAFIQYADAPSQSRGVRMYKTGDLARMRQDGNCEFVGRVDNQVKWMGYRIEISEIERALMSCDGVRCAVVALTEAGQGGLKELVGYYESDADISPSVLTAALQGQLPAYMVPRRLVRMEEIPRCGRGKVDRGALCAAHNGSKS